MSTTISHEAKEQITAYSAIMKFNLSAEFVRRSKAGQSRDELVAWLRATIGNRAFVFYPADFRTIRRKLDCSCEHGGHRKQRGRKLLSK
jgi:hypothetical protein